MDSPHANEPTAYHPLRSELARLCLPEATHDPNRTLAYVTSLALLFLAVGLAGLKSPQPCVRLLPEAVEIVPVVFIPPGQASPLQAGQTQDQPDAAPETPPDTPVVATVVAADTSVVRFAVPVSGSVILAPARFADAPPAQTKVTTAPLTRFVPTGREDGSYPWPKEYPRQALQQRQEGTVMLLVAVGESGRPESVTVKDSSGFPVLDRFALQWVREKWQWPSGRAKQYYVPFEFHLR